MKKLKMYLKILLMIGLASLVSCTSLNKKKHPIQSSLPSNLKKFDHSYFPNNLKTISKMIEIVQPEIEYKDKFSIAKWISKAVDTYKISPQIFVSIIDTESNFKNDKISSTGDLSLAQINVDVWNKEFNRMNIKLINKKQIKNDLHYSIMKMGEILSIIKKRYAKHDRFWYARYHSNTHNNKSIYLNKLEYRFKLLANSKSLIKLSKIN